MKLSNYDIIIDFFLSDVNEVLCSRLCRNDIAFFSVVVVQVLVHKHF